MTIRETQLIVLIQTYWFEFECEKDSPRCFRNLKEQRGNGQWIDTFVLKMNLKWCGVLLKVSCTIAGEGACNRKRNKVPVLVRSPWIMCLQYPM